MYPTSWKPLNEYIWIGHLLLRLYMARGNIKVFRYNGQAYYYEPTRDGEVVDEVDRPEVFV